MSTKILPVAALLLAVMPLVAPCSAQEPPVKSPDITTVPEWLVNFSNLPREEREQYLRAFNNAKRAYQQGQWVACIGFLADCEILFSENPNVWNLRACCLMEQKFFDEAAEELERAIKVLPADPVTALNLANMHMIRGRYAESIAVLDNLQAKLPYDSPRELLDVLVFRSVLCHVLMGQESEAKALVAHLSAISDTPLYYYSQAVFALVRKDRLEASRCLRVASSIFSKGNALVPYQRALELSGIANMDAAAPRR